MHLTLVQQTTNPKEEMSPDQSCPLQHQVLSAMKRKINQKVNKKSICTYKKLIYQISIRYKAMKSSGLFKISKFKEVFGNSKNNKLKLNQTSFCLFFHFSQFRWRSSGFFLEILFFFIEFSTLVIYVRVFSQSIANYTSIESFSSTTLPISYKTIRTKTALSSKRQFLRYRSRKKLRQPILHVKYHLV